LGVRGLSCAEMLRVLDRDAGFEVRVRFRYPLPLVPGRPAA